MAIPTRPNQDGIRGDLTYFPAAGGNQVYVKYPMFVIILYIN